METDPHAAGKGSWKKKLLIVGWPLDFCLQRSLEPLAVTQGTDPGRQPSPSSSLHLCLNQLAYDLQLIKIHLVQGGFFVAYL